MVDNDCDRLDSEALYHQTSGVIEQVVHHYATIRRVNIPDMDQDDISQEIRLKCIQALSSPRYDPTKVKTSAYGFLFQCIHNHIYNIKRGIWTPNNPPCVRCKHWDKNNRKCTESNDTCSEMQKYKASMQKKAALRTPVGFQKDYIENQFFIVDSIDEFILDEYVSCQLPESLRGFYIQLKNGESLPENIHSELKRRIIKILKDDV